MTTKSVLLICFVIVSSVVSWKTIKKEIKKFDVEGVKGKEELIIIKKNKVLLWPIISIKYENWKSDVKDKFEEKKKEKEHEKKMKEELKKEIEFIKKDLKEHEEKYEEEPHEEEHDSHEE